MRVVIVALALIATAAVVITLALREQGPSALDMALGRVLQNGMSLAEVTAVLRRHDVAFTVDSTSEPTAIVKFGRKASRDGDISQVSETHIVFDSAGRVRGMLTATEIMKP
jgi:hypothetical protein